MQSKNACHMRPVAAPHASTPPQLPAVLGGAAWPCMECSLSAHVPCIKGSRPVPLCSTCAVRRQAAMRDLHSGLPCGATAARRRHSHVNQRQEDGSMMQAALARAGLRLRLLPSTPLSLPLLPHRCFNTTNIKLHQLSHSQTAQSQELHACAHASATSSSAAPCTRDAAGHDRSGQPASDAALRLGTW